MQGGRRVSPQSRTGRKPAGFSLRRRRQGMQVTAPDRDELRRLAEIRLDRPVVLSLYLNLDPAEFATPPARATAVRSLLDEADRRIRDLRDLPHEDKMDLREIEQIHDLVFGQHDQGGWSQANYQRGIEKEKDDHLKHTAEALMKHFKL